MDDLQNLLHGKLILIYGFGKSGYSSYEFLKKKILVKLLMTIIKKLNLILKKNLLISKH